MDLAFVLDGVYRGEVDRLHEVVDLRRAFIGHLLRVQVPQVHVAQLQLRIALPGQQLQVANSAPPLIDEPALAPPLVPGDGPEPAPPVGDPQPGLEHPDEPLEDDPGPLLDLPLANPLGQDAHLEVVGVPHDFAEHLGDFAADQDGELLVVDPLQAGDQAIHLGHQVPEIQRQGLGQRGRQQAPDVGLRQRLHRERRGFRQAQLLQVRQHPRQELYRRRGVLLRLRLQGVQDVRQHHRLGVQLEN